MKIFLTLIKTSLNVNFGISALKYRFTKEKKKLGRPIIIGVCAAFGIGMIIVMITAFMLGLFIAGKSMGKPEIVLTFGFVTAQYIVLVFGLFYIMGAFYFSRDLNILIPLPLKPYQVMGSKFVVVMINEYLTLVPILLPSIVIFGIGTGQDLFYWLKGLVLLLTAPIIPLIIGSVFVVILMRFVNLRKSKDLLAVVGGFFGLLIAVGSNYFAQRVTQGKQEEFFKNFLASQSGIVESIGGKFPSSIWATYGLSLPGLEGLGYFTLFVGVSVLLFIILLWLGNQIFYKSLLSGQEATRKRKVISGTDISRKYRKTSSPVSAMFWREWKTFLRTPIYVMNGIGGMVVAPFLIVMPFITKNKDMNEIFSIIQNPKNAMFVTLGCLALILLTSSMNIVASTSVSREGNTFWISKMIPVAPSQQAISKILHSIAVSFIGIIVTGIVLAVVLKLSVFRLILLFFMGIIGDVLMVILNLMVDVLRPKLDWTNPQEAVKSNLNGLFGVLVTIVAMLVLGAVVLVLILANTPEWLVYLSLILIMIAGAALSFIGLRTLAEKRYGEIEA